MFKILLQLLTKNQFLIDYVEIPFDENYFDVFGISEYKEQLQNNTMTAVVAPKIARNQFPCFNQLLYINKHQTLIMGHIFNQYLHYRKYVIQLQTSSMTIKHRIKMRNLQGINYIFEFFDAISDELLYQQLFEKTSGVEQLTPQIIAGLQQEILNWVKLKNENSTDLHKSEQKIQERLIQISQAALEYTVEQMNHKFG